MSTRGPDPGVGAFAGLLGIDRSAMQDGRARFEVRVRPEHMNPHGAVHGGVIYTLVDYYLAAVSQGGLSAEAWLVARSNRVAVLEARVNGDADRLVALATGSFYIQPARV